MGYPVNKGLDAMSLFFLNVLFSDNLVISVQWEEFLTFQNEVHQEALIGRNGNRKGK